MPIISLRGIQHDSFQLPILNLIKFISNPAAQMRPDHLQFIIQWASRINHMIALIEML